VRDLGLTAGATPRYLFRERLGAGGMAEVHLGTMVSPAGARSVAIKRLLPKAAPHNEAETARIVAEARLVFRLTHANICQVLDLGQNEDGTFIVMEYVHGLDLGTLVKRVHAAGERLDPTLALHIAREVCQALDYAHRRADDDGQLLAIVHGDVTPRNVLLSIAGEVKLTDFGIARALARIGGSDAPGNQLRGGTPGFIAPEAAGGNVDHRADIYSLGMTLAAALDSPDESLQRLIRRAIATRPAERFLSAAEFEAALVLELNRRDPGFTPARLASCVRAHHEARPQEATDAMEKTLSSLTGGTVYSVVSTAKRRTEPTPKRRPLRGWVVAAVLAVLLTGTIGATSLFRRQTMEVAPLASTAMTSIVPQRPATPSALSLPALPPAAREAPPRSAVREAPSPPPSREPAAHARSRAPTKRGKGYLTVNSKPWGVLFVDGKKVADETPVYRLPLAEGTHRVAIFYPDRGAYSAGQSVTLHAGETRIVGFKQ
jgi:hypothetical protein